MRSFHVFFFSTALLSSGIAFAQAAPDDDIVVTASGVEQPRDEVGQAITVLDAATIETRQDINVADLLATTPGVRFNRNGAAGGVTGVSLRGAETTQTLVLIDGVKVNDPSGIGDMFDFGALLVGNIRRIEVLRGSNSVVHGSQAIGGVVNVMTGAPADGFAANASAEYGYSDTFSGKADVSGRAGALEGGAGLAYFRSDGISSFDRALGGSERDGAENVSANARLKVGLGAAVSLDLRGYYIRSEVDLDGYLPPEYAFGDTPEANLSEQYIGYAGLNVAAFGGRFNSRFAATYFRHDRDHFALCGEESDYGYRGESKRFDYRGELAVADQARLIFGYEHEKPEYRYADAYSGQRAGINTDSVFALALLKPLPGLAVTAGARHDDHSQFGGATTLGANANWAVAEGTNLRASYGEGFKAPSLYQLYDVWSGNAALQPEQSKSYDVGIDQRLLDGQARLSATLFHRDTHDQINYDGGTWRYANLDRTRARGIELTAAIRPVAALSASASYSYVDAKDRSPDSVTLGNRLPRRAEHAVSVSMDYDWRFGLSAGATVTHVSGSYDTIANSTRVEGYVIAAVRASLPVTDRVELYGRVENLFDEQYRTVAGYGTYGRAAYAGVRVKFD